MVGVEEPWRIGRGRPIFASGHLYLRRRVALSLAHPPRDTERHAARRSSDAYGSSWSLSASSTRRGPAAARRCLLPVRRESARPGSRPSWPGGPATRGSRCSSVARSIWSARNCRTSRSWTPCVRWASSTRDRRFAAAGVRGVARAAHRAGDGRAGTAHTRGSPLGRRVNARPRRLSRPQPPGPARPVAGHAPGRRAVVGRPDASAGGRRPAVRVRARARSGAAAGRGVGGTAGGSGR